MSVNCFVIWLCSNRTKKGIIRLEKNENEMHKFCCTNNLCCCTNRLRFELYILPLTNMRKVMTPSQYLQYKQRQIR